MSVLEEAADDVLEIPTPQGPGRFHLYRPRVGRAAGRFVLGHGAGGGMKSADLLAAIGAATGRGFAAALFEQPWKVAGRRVATPPATLDVAWRAALPVLDDALPGVGGPLVLGGRSAGARVACRTAADLGAVAVCCLAFPLHPPGRPERSRAPELAGAGLPALVVQGERDPFGTPGEIAALDLAHVVLAAVPGTHTIRAAARVETAVGDWLGTLRT